MPTSLKIERENLPPVVQGWIKTIGLADAETVELVFTERELLIRRPGDSGLRTWADDIVDRYDTAFRDLLDL